MSFYSYKNANAELCPGTVSGNVCNGLNERICVQVMNVYDSCLQQEQLDDVAVTVANIVPVLPDPNCRNIGSTTQGCNCNCVLNQCSCNCPGCPGNGVITHEQAVENAERSTCPLPAPIGQWNFESCRSASTKGQIRNLSIDRMCDRPQFARVKGIVDIPIDVLFTDDRCQEWMGTSIVSIQKDVLLAIPEESIVPFTLESLVSAICVSGQYIGNCKFEITICVTVVLKILAEVELMIPSYGYCQIPPCEEFAENVCDEFFSLPLFPQKPGPSTVTCGCNNNGNNVCPPAPTVATMQPTYATTSMCSNCGTTTAGSNSSLCPRCGCTMTLS